MSKNELTGKLYVVATPIGNSGDITLRAVEVLGDVDAVICEERKEGSKLLKQLGLQKPLIELNEHNENEVVRDILIELVNGKSYALISDGGTPIFNDPGRQLIKLLYDGGISISPIPGVASLTAAISVCPFDLDQFLFLGFLPPKTDARERALSRHTSVDLPIILMDTPYRLSKLLAEVSQVFGRNQTVFLACDITLPNEALFLGTIQEVIAKVNNRKAEFILILDKPERRRRY
jgi:16S rRNA (cytidine1402-2'-O)-methyltransferase